MAAFHYPDLVTAASASASSAVPEGVHERATEPKLVAPARNIRLIYGNVQKSFCQVHRPSLLLSVARCYIFLPFLANQEIPKQFQQCSDWSK